MIVIMKLVTFQSLAALKYLINHGELICDEKFIDKTKTAPTYNWLINKMNEQVPNHTTATYPLWCWVKCYNSICPPKHRGPKVEGFDVKITFHKPENDVFITDFRRFSFVLNNIFIPNNQQEKEEFFEKINQLNITLEDLKMFTRPDKYKSHRNDDEYVNICQEIRSSFDRCITNNSDILQGCIWDIKLSEVESIEILKEDGYTYGSLNYKRSNGKRIDWQKDYYKLL